VSRRLKADTLFWSGKEISYILKLYEMAVSEKEKMLKRKVSYENYKDSC